MSTDQPALNTDRELFRESTGTMPSDYYENSVHVTVDGKIGMNAGGRVVELPIAEWLELAWPKPSDPMSTDTTRKALFGAAHPGELANRLLSIVDAQAGKPTDPWSELARAVWVQHADRVAAAVAEKDAEIERLREEVSARQTERDGAVDTAVGVASERDEALADADSLRAVALDERATTIRVAEQRDRRANQVEEALSVLEMVKDRVDDFTYDELSSVLEDGPLDDERGCVIPSPLRRERDEARAEVDRLKRLVAGYDATHAEHRRRVIDRDEKIGRLGAQVDIERDLADEIDQRLGAQLAEARAALSAVKALADDLVKHGLRFDLNPTMPSTGPGHWLHYIARMDQHARGIGDGLLELLTSAHGAGLDQTDAATDRPVSLQREGDGETKPVGSPDSHEWLGTAR